jgi:tripartite-type tricarboxylate transporter receptor subunit TctC
VQQLNFEVARILAQSEVRERLEREGSDIVSGSPERLNEIIDADLARWKKLTAETKLRLD